MSVQPLLPTLLQTGDLLGTQACARLRLHRMSSLGHPACSSLREQERRRTLPQALLPNVPRELKVLYAAQDQQNLSIPTRTQQALQGAPTIRRRQRARQV